MTTSNNLSIIGVAGTFGSGKDTLAEYLLEQKNYFHVSTGDLVREESEKRHNSTERNPYLQETATYLRRTFGGDILIKKGLERFEQLQQSKTYHGVVFTGLRSLGEAKGIKQAGGQLIFVDAPVEIRYKRMQDRKRDNEINMSLEGFKASEANEQTQSDDDAEFNIYRIKDEADDTIMNDDTLETFIKRAEKALTL